MLSFKTGQPDKKIDETVQASAYLFGGDGVPIRADFRWDNDLLICDKRVAGPAGLAILWNVPGAGKFLLETTRLLERNAPYILPVELARGHLMRVQHKREEWGLFDIDGIDHLNNDIRTAVGTLVRAMQANSPGDAAKIGTEALAQGVRVGENFAKFHADVLLDRRKQTAGFSPHIVGCQINLKSNPQTCGPLVADAFDYASIPMNWKDIEPTEGKFNWKPIDAWIEWLSKKQVPLKGSQVLCFQQDCFPDWLKIWEHDFETVRTLAADHVRRVVKRYAKIINVWDVTGGLHAPVDFGFSFEQLMELTRIATNITRQVVSRCVVTIEIITPWGEYYARNQRSIPPMLYADMAIQSGINVDGVGLQIRFGPDVEGLFVRDLFQISAMIERFGNLGKPLHITAVQVPSASDNGSATGGQWHDAWSESCQSEWVDRFYRLALSKPFVETVTWQDLTDATATTVPHGGLLKTDLTPKPAYQKIIDLRQEIRTNAPRE